VIKKSNQQKDTLNEHYEDGVLTAFKRYKSALKFFISSYVVNSQDVDDVCQETFLLTYKSSLKNEILKPKSFMFRVAKNLIVSDFRSASTQLNNYVADIDLIDSKLELDNLENNALAQEKLGVMCKAIAGLPNKCRQAVVMRKVYGLATKDIAKRMNISTITVSNYITKGMLAYNDAVILYNSEQNETMNTEKPKNPIETGRTL